ncbi:MAG: DUF1016 family protein [Bacteroidetes bacterium]|nr:DUF1016 family protein [Bacteroidota bacterium]
MQTEDTYKQLLNDVKQEIAKSRLEAVQTVNRKLIQLYWQIGMLIHQRQEIHGWGKAVVKQLSEDLQIAYPSSNSFSPRNLWFMRQLYEEYSQNHIKAPKVKQPVSLLSNPLDLLSKVPWGHNILIMQRLKDISERLFYLEATSQFGWTRNVLLNQIKADAYQRQNINPEQHNFNQTLEPYLEEQAIESIKSSYNLEFLGIFQPVKEKELEDKLIDNLEKFLLELGYGFTFIGRQYKLTLGENSYFIDLLFYNRKLQSLVAFELKAGKFKPEYAGKMNFYLELLDEQAKEINENSSIGIILCAEKDHLEVEYALRISNKPMGVVEYELTKKLPSELNGKLPTAKEFRDKLDKI